MATAPKATTRPRQAQPTPTPAPATGETPADWPYPKPRGTSALTPEQRAALQATPAVKAKAKPPTPKAPPAQAKPPKTPATPTGPTPGEAYIVGQPDGEDLWEFAPVSAEPSAAVMVRHYQGYTLLREHRRSAAYAAKLHQGFPEESEKFFYASMAGSVFERRPSSRQSQRVS
jgi:hypothetical protein